MRERVGRSCLVGAVSCSCCEMEFLLCCVPGAVSRFFLVMLNLSFEIMIRITDLICVHKVRKKGGGYWLLCVVVDFLKWADLIEL